MKVIREGKPLRGGPGETDIRIHFLWTPCGPENELLSLQWVSLRILSLSSPNMTFPVGFTITNTDTKRD